jgi:hypothetical protein
MNKINTASEKTINETLKNGQFIRNGATRLFEIVNLTDTTVDLICKNDESIKPTRLSRKVFVQLYYRKNYVQSTNPANFSREAIELKITGSERYLIKH